MHGGIENVRYWYSNRRFSSRAVDHAFKYISAVTGIRFTRDRSAPQIWRSDDGPAPESIRIDLGQSDETNAFGESYSRTGDSQRATVLEGDPVEDIIKRISLRAELGPMSAVNSSGKGADVPRLSQLTSSIVRRLSENGLIERKTRGVDLWPGGSRFGVAITHDVDITRRSLMGSFRLLWHKDPQGRFRGLVDSMASIVGGRNPYDKIPDWLGLERDYGFRSTFFVFAGNRRHRNDPKYRLSDLANSIEQVLGNGFELALHSGIACHSGESLSVSASVLEGRTREKTAGLRPHYLSAYLPEYWRTAAAAGFAYTSCLGFDDDIGYFNGIDLPFVPFDVENDSAIDIVEIPIAIMDCGLVGNDSADSDDVFEKGRSLIDEAERAGGLTVLDWHQRTLYDPDYPGWGRLFRKLVDHVRGRKAHFATMREISSLLKERMAGEG